MLVLAHTDGLPRFDRAELFAIWPAAPDAKPEDKDKPNRKTFPIHPYNFQAHIYGKQTITGSGCSDIRAAWQALTFDPNSIGLCHIPAYGIRLYRGDSLLFETSVCWKCQNSYIPRYDLSKKQVVHVWYGFKNDDNAKKLLKLFRSKLPHPKL